MLKTLFSITPTANTLRSCPFPGKTGVYPRLFLFVAKILETVTRKWLMLPSTKCFHSASDSATLSVPEICLAGGKTK